MSHIFKIQVGTTPGEARRLALQNIGAIFFIGAIDVMTAWLVYMKVTSLSVRWLAIMAALFVISTTLLCYMVISLRKNVQKYRGR